MKMCRIIESHLVVGRFPVVFYILTAIKQALLFSVEEIKAHAIVFLWVRFMVKCNKKSADQIESFHSLYK